MKQIIFVGFLLLPLISCNSYFHSNSLSQASYIAPGLNLTLPTQTIRSNLTAVTAGVASVDSNTFVAAGTSPWVSNVSAPRIGGTYQSVLGNGTVNSLTGVVVATTKSRLLLFHQITTDSAALAVTLNGVSLPGIAAGLTNTGWTYTDLGTVAAGSHNVVIQTSDAGPKFGYVDGFILLPVSSIAAGLQQKGWFEQDHPHIYKTGTWNLLARPGTFPFTVSTTTGTGAANATNAGDASLIFVESAAPATLRIFSQLANNQGIMNVKINGVSQTQFDQYSATAIYKSYRDYSLIAGEHLVELSVSGAKNAASSGFAVYQDAIELRTTVLTDEQRALAMVDSIVSNISSTDGASRVAYDSSLFNQDNDSGYSMMALALAVARWNIPEHVVALKNNLQWFSNIMQSDGVWYWGYCKEGEADCPRSYIEAPSGAVCKGGYCPSVNSYYAGLTPPITAIRSIDAPQSFPTVGLAIYASLFPGDTAFINSLKPGMLKSIDALIANNYDPSNGYFYSSYQYKTGLGWRLFEAQYSAGQCDVYMGLMSAYSLSGDVKYKNYADHIKTNFDRDFFDSSRNVYTVGLFGPMGQAKVKDTTTYYGFTQGWCAWIFGPGVLTNASTSLATVKTWVQPNGYSILPPLATDPQSSQSAWLLMGLRGLGIDSVIQENLKARFRNYQLEYHPELQYGHGSIQFSDTIPYFYTSNAGWGFIGLTQQASPATWWR